MKTITIKEGCSTPVNIGEKGENGVGAVLFDYSEWLNDFGNGAISLLVKRKGDTAAYPVVLTTADGIATWTISDTDTAVQGYGKAEYIFTIDDKVAKSAVFSFFVAHDLGPSGDPPDPYESWIDTLTALGGETLINAQAAQAAQEAAETAQENAETAATNAATSATNAAQSAGAARFAAESALSSADSASASATSATASESAASESATQAAASATAAEASETAAYDSANTAAEESELAQTAATNAQQSASNAYDYAAQAMEAASDAQAAEQTASASATTASNAATNATQSANNAAQSASAASQSATQAASSESNAAASATSAETSATEAATSEANAAQSATEAEASAQEAAEQAAKLNNYLPVDTASGAIASFPDGADSVPVEALTVSLEPVQDLNGQSSPYPAGGGKNKINAPDVTLAGGAYVFNLTGLSIPAGQYTLSYTTTAANNISLAVTGPDGDYLNITVTNPFTFTTSGVITGIRAYGTAGAYSNIQLESGSSKTAFAPYENICPITGHTSVGVWREATYDTTAQPQITIPLGQTVYGGTLDVVHGVLTVDRAMVDLGSLTWTTSSNRARVILSDATEPPATSVLPTNLTFSAMTLVKGNSTLSQYGQIAYILVSGANTLIAYYNGTLPTGQLVYELATPITIDLTAHELTTLLGQNNIWSDSGDVDVTYRADIQKYITKVISEALA